jgi:hypothetical protein
MLAYVFIALGIVCLVLFFLSKKIGKGNNKVAEKKQ